MQRSIGDRETSTCLRFKYGRNVRVEDEHTPPVRNPKDFKVPTHGLAVDYVIAYEDYYLVYPTDYHKFLNHYHDTFQHGGISTGGDGFARDNIGALRKYLCSEHISEWEKERWRLGSLLHRNCMAAKSWHCAAN